LLYRSSRTRKSSLSLSITSHFDLDIYILNLVSINNITLNRLFAKLLQHYIILLEDIDITSQRRIQDKEVDYLNSFSEKQRKEVTLSGLLNALNRVESQEDRLLIMTTNYIEQLDDILIRPGRVDRKIEFRLANKNIVNQLFCIVFKDSDSSDNTTIEHLANDFANRIPESEFSPAEILSLLLEHKLSPKSTIASIEAWIARVREEKGNKLKREDSWIQNT
jgi:mitochondrial chaperone BCS1